MTLQWAAREFVDVDDLPIWVTRKVDANVNANFSHLLVNLCLEKTFNHIKREE